jgi:hypothetical protein
MGAPDKELHLVPGDHYFAGGGRDDTADLLAGWLEPRT